MYALVLDVLEKHDGVVVCSRDRSEEATRVRTH